MHSCYKGSKVSLQSLFGMIKIGNIELPEFPLLLAPMEDVSDPPFRLVCKENGVDLMYTEFISSEGLIRDAAKSRMKLDIFEYERPIGVQIFGSDTETMVRCAEIIEATNPDLLDINYGCPVSKVTCKGAGLGWDEDSKNVVEVAERLQDIGIQALTVHGRTRVQMYKGSADWTLIARIKENPRMRIPVFGNGDIDSPEKAVEYKNRYGVDGVMIGRASIGYPWIFNEIKHFVKTGEKLPPPSVAMRAEACRKHFEFSLQWKGPVLGVLEMRRHYSNYFKGLPHFKEDRMELVTTHDAEVILRKLDEIVTKYDGVDFLV